MWLIPIIIEDKIGVNMWPFKPVRREENTNAEIFHGKPWVQFFSPQPIFTSRKPLVHCNWTKLQIKATCPREALLTLVCVAGAAVSSRGGRGKLFRDTNEKGSTLGPFVTTSFSFALSVSSPLHVTLLFPLPQSCSDPPPLLLGVL